MKRTKLTMMALAGAFLLASCGETKKENETEDGAMPMQNEMHMEETDDHAMEMDMAGNLDDGQTGEVEFSDEDIASAYQHYMHVKTALVNTNAEEAQSGGKMLVEALGNVENNTKALEAAQTVANSQEINEQRTAFLELSAGMEEVMSGAIISGELYKQYCPMAFDGKGGSWLSASKEIRNPFYGDKMLKCGRVTDTISGS
jgi:major membrane immunogen (membrane-anchored lipoprotein)